MLGSIGLAVKQMGQLPLADVIMLAVVVILVYEARSGWRVARAWVLPRIRGRSGTNIVNESPYRPTGLAPVEHPALGPLTPAPAHTDPAMRRVEAVPRSGVVNPNTRWALTLLVIGVALMFVGTQMARPAAGRT
jgi:hypothetical protein